jgi:hypothetical protein
LDRTGVAAAPRYLRQQEYKKFPCGAKFNAFLLIYMTRYSRRKGAGWNIAGKAITGTGG